MYVEVEQEHIDKGKPEDSRACAVALAIYERTGKRVDVCDDELRYSRCGSKIRAIEPPLSVKNFVRAFDSGGKVEPFGFELDETLFS
jgi:hypothetical protein